MSKPRASDAEIADFLIGHIDNPCEITLPDGSVANIRNTYLREAELMLPTMTDSDAIVRLTAKVQQYRGTAP